MENEKLDAVLKSFAAFIAPSIMAHINQELVFMVHDKVKLEMDARTDYPGKVDQDMVADIVRSELSEMELVDEDRARELAREEMDDIDLTCNGGFQESVEQVVRGMSFSVEIS